MSRRDPLSKGYICLAQNNSTTDYLRQAYALALNLKLTQSEVSNLSVCVDKETKKLITAKHRKVFDHVIDIPWLDDAKDAEWKIDNKWKFFYMSPYDETVILDSDMLFPMDVSHWWNILAERDVWSTTSVKTYRGEIANSDYYRKTFTANELPNVYMAFFYFKKSELAACLFSMIEIIFQHWQRMFYKYLPKGKPDWLSGDVSFALAMKILGIEDQCCKDNVQDVPTFVHMKSHVQNINRSLISEDWMQSLPTYYSDCTNFKIGNFRQIYPFHYVNDKWLTDQMIVQMEKQLNK